MNLDVYAKKTYESALENPWIIYCYAAVVMLITVITVFECVISVFKGDYIVLIPYSITLLGLTYWLIPFGRRKIAAMKKHVRESKLNNEKPNLKQIEKDLCGSVYALASIPLILFFSLIATTYLFFT